MRKVFVLQVLNSAGEWELIHKQFANAVSAVSYYFAELNMFEGYEIVQLQ